MNIWDLLKETPDQRKLRKMRERSTTKRKRTAPTSHPDDFYGFDGLNEYSKKQRQRKQ